MRSKPGSSMAKSPWSGSGQPPTRRRAASSVPWTSLTAVRSSDGAGWPPRPRGQRAAQAGEGIVVELVAVARGEAVERLHEHGRVARARQLAPGIAEDGVLAPVGLVAQRVAADAHQRAQAFERLARVVDRAIEVAARGGPGIEPVAGMVELPAGDAANAVGGVLVAAQAVGAGTLGLAAARAPVARALVTAAAAPPAAAMAPAVTAGAACWYSKPCPLAARWRSRPIGALGRGGRLRRPARAASVRGWLRAPTDAGEAAPAGCATP